MTPQSPEVPPLRYVVLRHEGIDEPHFDLMFEAIPGGELTTWRAELWPVQTGNHLTRLPAHRSDYLHYEGSVSKGRGTVRRVEAGHCAILEQSANRFGVICESGLELELRRESDNRWRAAVNQM